MSSPRMPLRIVPAATCGGLIVVHIQQKTLLAQNARIVDSKSSDTVTASGSLTYICNNSALTVRARDLKLCGV